MRRCYPSIRRSLTIVSVVVSLSLTTGCAEDPAATDQPPAGCIGCVEGSLQISDERARSCEAVVHTPVGDSPVVITFADGVTGRALTEGDRTGIAFVAAAGQRLPQAPATLTAPGELSLVSSRCFDNDGAAINGSSLSL